MSFCVHVSVCTVICVAFWNFINVDRNYMQRMRPQSMGSNPMSGSIICLSVCMSGCLQAFCNFCIYINFQFGGPASQLIYPLTGVRSTPVWSSRSYISVSVSIYLAGCPRKFLEIIRAARNCVQRMRLQSMVSNPLSGSIICPSVHMSVRSSAGLLHFFYLY